MANVMVYAPAERAELPGLLAAGLLASPMMLLEGALSGFRPHEGTDRVIGLVGLVYMLGWLSSLQGLYWTRATGYGRLGRAWLRVQAATVAVAALWSASHVLFPDDAARSLACSVFDLAWPLSHLLMVFTGLGVLRAGVWTGWARVTPLLCGLALPLAFLTHAASWETAMSAAFGAWTFGAFALLAFAVRQQAGRGTAVVIP